MLALLFTGYFVLSGLDYGVAILGGRPSLARITPFVLGNEVWLVAALGYLFGVYPLNEGTLLGAHRVPVGIALLGVVITTALYGLRLFTSRVDSFLRVGGALASLGWGLVLGSLLFDSLLSVLFLFLTVAHGWAFLHRRLLLAVTSALYLAIVLWAGSQVDWIRGGLGFIDIVLYLVLPIVIAAQAFTWWLLRRTPTPSPATP